jgi:hypothetical protein
MSTFRYIPKIWDITGATSYVTGGIEIELEKVEMNTHKIDNFGIFTTYFAELDATTF